MQAGHSRMVQFTLLHLTCTASTPTAGQEWMQKRSNAIRTIWADGVLPLERTQPDEVEPTNVTGMQRLRWTVSSAYVSLDAFGYYHRRSITTRSRTLVVMHMGHAWSNWDYNCRRHCAVRGRPTQVRSAAVRYPAARHAPGRRHRCGRPLRSRGWTWGRVARRDQRI